MESRQIPAQNARPNRFSQRLKKVRLELGLSQKVMADRIGFSEHQVRDAERGKNVPSAVMLEKISRVFSICAAWLLKGEQAADEEALRVSEADKPYDALSDDDLISEIGERLKGRARATTVAHMVHVEDKAAFEAMEGLQNYWALPYMADPASAGTGRIVEDEVEGYVVVHTSICRDPESLFCARITGDSMEPTLTDGSIAAIDRTQQDARALKGRIICARTETDEVVIKRILPMGSCILLESDNPRYEPIHVDTRVQEHCIIGQVVWAWLDMRE